MNAMEIEWVWVTHDEQMNDAHSASNWNIHHYRRMLCGQKSVVLGPGQHISVKEKTRQLDFRIASGRAFKQP